MLTSVPSGGLVISMVSGADAGTSVMAGGDNVGFAELGPSNGLWGAVEPAQCSGAFQLLE